MKTSPRRGLLTSAASLLLAGSIAALLSCHSVQAASGTWDGGSVVDGNWSTTTNWLGDPAAPGSTSLTNSTDVATFNAAIANTWGLTGTPIVIDSTTQNIGGISFALAAGNYFLGSTAGNALKLSSTGTIQILNTLTATNAIETINAPLVLHGGYTFANNSANGSGAGAGTLNFGGSITSAVAGNLTLTLSGSNTNANTITGLIANGAATNLFINKSGAGTWALNGANTFSGQATVSDGTLSIDSIANVGTPSALGQGGAGFTIILGSSSSVTTGKLQFTGASGGSSNRNIALATSRGTVNGIIENTVAGQTLTLSGTVTSTSIIGGVQDQILEVTGAGNGVLSGAVNNQVGSTNLIKTGAGTWTFSGNNSHTGTTTVSGGTLKLGSTRALGFGGTHTTLAGSTTVNSGFTLDLNGSTAINEPIIVNGTGIGGNGALVNSSGTPASIANGLAALTVAATGSGSGFSSAPAVVITGTGTGATATASLGVTTASITSVSGGTGWVTGDTVGMIGGGGQGSVGTVTASGGAITSITMTVAGRGFTSAPTGIQRLTGSGNTAGVTFTGNATNFTVGGLTLTNAGSGYTGTPTFTFNGSAATVTPTLSSVNLATDSSIGGAGNMTVNSVVSGAGLTKVGAGMVTLSGANTYNGATTVSEGTLLVSGSISASTTTVSNAGSTLGGTGTVGGVSVGSGAILQGGDGATATGALTSGGAVSLLDGSIIKLTLGSGLTHSSLARIGGAWSFDSVDSNQAFAFTLLPGAIEGFYDNVISGLSGSETGLGGVGTWIIITGGVSGTFSYDNAGGVDLSVTAIPEPGTAALLLGSGLLLLARRRSAQGWTAGHFHGFDYGCFETLRRRTRGRRWRGGLVRISAARVCRT